MPWGRDLAQWAGIAVTGPVTTKISVENNLLVFEVACKVAGALVDCHWLTKQRGVRVAGGDACGDL